MTAPVAPAPFVVSAVCGVHAPDLWCWCVCGYREIYACLGIPLGATGVAGVAAALTTQGTAATQRTCRSSTRRGGKSWASGTQCVSAVRRPSDLGNMPVPSVQRLRGKAERSKAPMPRVSNPCGTRREKSALHSLEKKKTPHQFLS